MTKTVTVQARMEPKLKEQVDVILASLGINATTAITLFYAQVVRHRGIPLELKVPNDELMSAITETKDPKFREKAKKYNSVSELMTDLNS